MLRAVAAVSLLTVAVPVVAQTIAPTPAPQQEESPKAKQKPKAKSAKQDASAGKKDPVAAQQQVDAGVASLQAGKVDLAVQQLTAAIIAGGLPPSQMARAQHQRGIAYRKQNKHALAISDLTQALYIKNGLVEADRADAMQNRVAAYRDAGLPDQDDGQSAKVSAAQRNAAVRSAPAPAMPIATSTPTPPAPAVSDQPRTAAPAPTESASATTSSSGLGGFFGNLFGGSTPAAEPSPVAPAPKREIAVSAWNSGTEVKSKVPTEPVKTAKPLKADPYAIKVAGQAAPTSTGSIVQATAGTNYSIQIAQLKTRAEAQAVATKVEQQFGADLAGRSASITAVAQGGFGTLHRVTFGPFANAADWKALCPKLLNANLDCQPLKE